MAAPDDLKLQIDAERLAVEKQRLAVEVQRLTLEQQRTYLTQWETDLAPRHENQLEASKASVTFAQNALRGVFLLNGGALIALPTFTSAMFGGGSVGLAARLLPSIALFALGVVLCLLAHLCGFFSLSKTANALSRDIELVKLSVNEQNNRVRDAAAAANERTTNTADKMRLNRRADFWRNLGIGFLVAALISFVIGAGAGGVAILNAPRPRAPAISQTSAPSANSGAVSDERQHGR